jgi:hypothetical protein
MLARLSRTGELTTVWVPDEAYRLRALVPVWGDPPAILGVAMPISASQAEAAPRRTLGMRYPTADEKLLNRRDSGGA